MLEDGIPEPEDTTASEAFSYLLAVIDLEQALRDVPDGRRWLQLVLDGYSGHEAMRMLRRDWHWLKRVREVCKRALYP